MSTNNLNNTKFIDVNGLTHFYDNLKEEELSKYILNEDIDSITEEKITEVLDNSIISGNESNIIDVDEVVTGVKVNGITTLPTNGIVDLGKIEADNIDIDSITEEKITEVLDNSIISGNESNIIDVDEVVTGVKVNGVTTLPTNGIVDLGNSITNTYEHIYLGNSSTSMTINPNKFYEWSTVTNLQLSLAGGASGITNEYTFQFTSGSTATTLTLPNTIKWVNGETPLIESNCTYQISILNGLATILKFYN